MRRLLKPILIGCALYLAMPQAPALAQDPLPEQPEWQPQGTAFTYQGRLDQDGLPLDGRCDFRFSLFDGPFTARPPYPAQVGQTVEITEVTVDAGLFMVNLNFGPRAFDGAARWLKTEVGCPAPANAFTALTPWMRLTPTPGAIFAATAGSAEGLRGRRVADQAPLTGQFLAWDGSAWSPASAPGGGIGPGGVTEDLLADGAVTGRKLADRAVASEKLADGAVLRDKLAPRVVGNEQLADGAVTTAKVADRAVGTGHLADGAVTGAKIADRAVGSGQLASGSVTAEKLANGAVGSGQLADAAVTAAKVAANAIDGSKVADGSLRAADVDANQIQRRVSGSCAAGQAIRAVDPAGAVTCQATSGSAGWGLTGNGGTNPASQFLGTTDSQPLVVRTAGAERLRVLANGNVGIGTTTPAARLELSGGHLALNDGMLRLRTGPDANHGVLYSGAVDGLELRGFGGLRWTTGANGANERLRMDANGNVGLGTAPNAAYRLDVNGVVRVTNLVYGSDARLKTDVVILPNALERLTRIRGVAFTWRDDVPGAPAVGADLGVLADEVEAVFPELVVTSPESGYKAVDYPRLSAVLVAAVNELRAESAARIAALETRAAAQARRLATLEAENRRRDAQVEGLQRDLSTLAARLAALEAAGQPSPVADRP